MIEWNDKVVNSLILTIELVTSMLYLPGRYSW